MLSSPAKEWAYTGPVYLLVDKKTGSAAEMLSGVLQAKKRGILAGQKTAGATYLKSIYDFDDGSMVFMITSLTFFPDRRVFPKNGLIPDIILDETIDSFQFVQNKISKV